MPSRPTFFASQAEFRAWLSAHHDRADQLLVGFHKRGTGKPSITWPESVDEALCYGWIDGARLAVCPPLRDHPHVVDAVVRERERAEVPLRPSLE